MIILTLSDKNDPFLFVVNPKTISIFTNSIQECRCLNEWKNPRENILTFPSFLTWIFRVIFFVCTTFSDEEKNTLGWKTKIIAVIWREQKWIAVPHVDLHTILWHILTFFHFKVLVSVSVALATPRSAMMSCPNR